MFGSLPGRGGGGLVECCLPLVLAHVAGPFSSCPPVHAGDTLVRLGRPAERVRAGGQRSYGGGVRLGRVAVGRFEPLAGGGQVLGGVPVSVPELLKPPADGIKPNNDLPLTAWRAPGLVVHASRHAFSSPEVLSDRAHLAGLGVARAPGVPCLPLRLGRNERARPLSRGPRLRSAQT